MHNSLAKAQFSYGFGDYEPEPCQDGIEHHDLSVAALVALLPTDPPNTRERQEASKKTSSNSGTTQVDTQNGKDQTYVTGDQVWLTDPD